MYVLDVLVLPAAEIKRLFYAIRFVFPDGIPGHLPALEAMNRRMAFLFQRLSIFYRLL